MSTKNLSRTNVKTWTIGCNPVHLVRIYNEFMQNAEPRKALATEDAGIIHWAVLAAKNEGRLTVTTHEKADQEGRIYSFGGVSVQSMDKRLRPAFTAATPGHVLISCDWTASHWQLIAYGSKDPALLQALSNGTFYEEVMPGFTRSEAKLAMAARLNGIGLKKLGNADHLNSDEKAAKFVETYDANFGPGGKMEQAGAWIEQLKQDTLAAGYCTEEYKAAAVGLMRIEAQNLKTVMEMQLLKDMGATVVLPMHDEVLLSCPAEQADTVLAMVTAEMSRLVTGDATICVAKGQVLGPAWAAPAKNGNPQFEPALPVLGGDMRALAATQRRAAAATDCRTAIPVCDLIVAAAIDAEGLKSAVSPHSSNSMLRRSVTKAFKAVEAAEKWERAIRAKEAGPVPHPLVQLPHNKPSHTNLCLIVGNDTSLPSVAYNQLTREIEIVGLSFNDSNLRKFFLGPIQERYGFYSLALTELLPAIEEVARNNGYDPVLRYLHGLPAWDGTPRLYNWLTAYAGVEDTPLHRAYARKWILSVIARAYQPGCKVDSMLVLVGAQGAGKSTLFRVLSPAGSFKEGENIDPNDKDMVLRATKYAIVEWGEMTGLGKRDNRDMRNFLSRQVDEVRKPYGTTSESYPRRTVYCATTNHMEVLKDETGGRRFWTCKVTGAIDIPGLTAAKDQLWAEALNLYHILDGEIPANASPEVIEMFTHKLHLPPALVAEKEIADQNFTHLGDEVLYEELRVGMPRWFGNKRVKLRAVMVANGVEQRDLTNRNNETAYGNVLRRLGYVNRVHRENGEMARYWTPANWTKEDEAFTTEAPQFRQ